MALSQTYLEWEKQTKREGLEQGKRSAIESLMRVRFGAIDSSLEALMPRLTDLNSDDYVRLLLECSKDELIQRFRIENEE